MTSWRALCALMIVAAPASAHPRDGDGVDGEAGDGEEGRRGGDGQGDRRGRDGEAGGYDEVIVVVGLPVPRSVLDVPAAVTVVEREELERAAQVMADEVLRTQPSLATFRRSSSIVADPTSQGVNLRGVGPSAVSRALVLRDGVPVSDPFGGWMYWRAVRLLSVERVEIVPSGSSALFGNVALGGAIDVVSREIEPRDAEVIVAGGSHRTARGAARVADRRGGLGVAIDGEVLRSDGFAPIAADQRGAIDGAASSDHQAVGARAEYRGARRGVAGDGDGAGERVAHVTASWFRQHLDAGTQFTTADVRAYTVGGGWRSEHAVGTLDVDVFGGGQVFEQTRARVGEGRMTAALASRGRTPSNDQGAVATWSARSGRHTWRIGADARRVAGTATEQLTPPMIGPSSVVERAAGGEQQFAGLFAQDTVRVGRVQVLGALRLDGWRDLDGERVTTRGDGSRETERFAARDELQLDPRLGVLVDVDDDLALRASAYRAFRAPTLNELYRPFQVGTVLTEANPALRPETLWGAEAGPQLALERVVVRATGFYNRLDDAVANLTLAEPLPNGAMRQRANLGRTRIAGVELELAWRPHAKWHVVVAHTFTDARVVEAPARPELVGKRLAQDPRERTAVTISFDDPAIVTATAQVRHLGRQYEDDLQTLPMGSFTIVDARAERRLGRGIAVFASVQNVLDRRYLVGRAGVDTEGAPRTFELGLAYR